MVKRFFSVFLSCCVLMCSVFCFSAAADNATSSDMGDLNIFDGAFSWLLSNSNETLYSRPPELSDSYQTRSPTLYTLLTSSAPKVKSQSYVDVPFDLANPGDTGFSLVSSSYYQAQSNGTLFNRYFSLYMYGFPLRLTGAQCAWNLDAGAFYFSNVPSGSAVFDYSYSDQMLRANTSYYYTVIATGVSSSFKCYPKSSSFYSVDEQYSTTSPYSGSNRNISRGVITVGSAAQPVSSVSFDVTGLTGDGFYIQSYAFSPLTSSYDDVLDEIEQNTANTEQAIKDAAKQEQDNFDSTWEVGSSDVGQIGQAGQSGSSASDKVSALELADTISTGIFTLFDSDSLPAAEVTFPAFSIDVGGQSHAVWSDVSFDFSSLEENFGPLINAVRFATVALCYFALVKYLHKVYEDIFMGSVGGSD